MNGFDDEDDDLLLEAAMEIDSFDFGQKSKESAIKDVKEHCLTPPESFPFPFTPYDIQKNFMKNLYVCLEQGKIGVFESPTGTGKSLSLICGALQWLRDYQKNQLEQLQSLSTPSHENKDIVKSDQKKNTTEVDWIAEFARKKEQEESLEKIKKEQVSIQNRESKLKELQNSGSFMRKRKNKSKLDENFTELMTGASAEIKKACMKELESIENEAASNRVDEDGSDIILADYTSDDEKESKGAEEEEEEEDHVTKIYYCSRTHSQLAQFVREVMKSPFEDVRVVSLGSRQNMCINPKVQRLKSLTLINDKCLELKQKKSKSKPGCPFHKQELLNVFKDKALLDVYDIEQLVSLGRQSKTCPYFGARYAVPSAEVVALPYNTLLHKQTRSACGIKLAGSIVIIDEAHNLLETINNIHSIEISGAQVIKAHSQLSQYEKKFRGRLTANNLMYVNQILFVLSNLAVVLGGKVEFMAESQNNSREEVSLMTINDFLFKGHFDNMNMFKLLRYCQRSSISKKLHGFVDKYQDQQVQIESEKVKDGSGLVKFLEEIKSSKSKKSSAKQEPEIVSKPGWMSSPLMQIESFLEALTNANQDGRVVLSKQIRVSTSSLKFLMLNPSVSFGSVLNDARAIIVAGGTMQPINEFKDQLFFAAGVPPERIMEFSCGHVVPTTHILPIALSKGPTGLTLDLTFQNRNSPALIEEIGRIVLNLCNVVPGGIVCFFPSYDYEKLIYSSWEKAGVLQKIQLKKKHDMSVTACLTFVSQLWGKNPDHKTSSPFLPGSFDDIHMCNDRFKEWLESLNEVFREPKGSGLADQVLLDYSDCIKRCVTWQGSLTGAILLCVVGGKMSEGINFSDDLGRCVVMAGLPYPNIHSPELKEKMNYLNAHFPKDRDGRTAGQVHYENLCMKAVNQSIGRAIRHKEDYASIVLLDQRYQRPSIVSKLPSWISKHVQYHDRFSSLAQALPKFFSQHKRKKT